jgi:hypothetical protein
LKKIEDKLPVKAENFPVLTGKFSGLQKCRVGELFFAGGPYVYRRVECIKWVYASRIEKTPNRRHVVTGRNHFAFSDVRRLVAQAALDDNFGILFPVPRKSSINSLVAVLLRIAA